MRLRRFVTLGLILGLALMVSVSLVYPATGETRYTVSIEGVIKDSTTGLEWVVRPDKGASYHEAEAWVKGCKIAGGSWRMPTLEELKGLDVEGLGPRNMDPDFKITGWGVFFTAPPNDKGPSYKWFFPFVGDNGVVFWDVRADGRVVQGRAFGVRSAKK
jgi:hypothetical protein